MTRSRFLLLLVLSVFLAFAPTASASEAIVTGSATRVKTTFVHNFPLYVIKHSMASKPATKSKQAVIEADVNKMFEWNVLRDLPGDKVVGALKQAFADNGFGDAGRIAQFCGPFQKDLAEKSYVSIRYDAGAKTTTVKTPNGSATIAGADFMQGVWKIWFGKIDQPNMGDLLIANL